MVELVIVVATIGLLAAIAIPSFQRYQLRAKASEATTNLKAIATAQEAYNAEYNSYVEVSTPIPPALPGNVRSPWVFGSAFDTLGWAPEGPVHFQYLVNADGAGGTATRFTVEARGDIDADGAPSFFGFVKPDGLGGLNGSFPGTTCVGTGVYTAGSVGATGVAGPCDTSSGRTIF